MNLLNVLMLEITNGSGQTDYMWCDEGHWISYLPCLNSCVYVRMCVCRARCSLCLYDCNAARRCPRNEAILRTSAAHHKFPTLPVTCIKTCLWGTWLRSCTIIPALFKLWRMQNKNGAVVNTHPQLSMIIVQLRDSHADKRLRAFCKTKLLDLG